MNCPFYPKNQQPISLELFANPTAEYRGTPFWSWNSQLNAGQLRRQIGLLQRMGFGGFHMHPRTGLATPYLSPEYMQCIKACVDEAKQRHMLAWLYDEDRWPSGFAGGLVTCDPQYRTKHLLFTTTPYAHGKTKAHSDSRAEGGRSQNGTLLACYRVALNADGTLAEYCRLSPAEVKSASSSKSSTIWYAYIESPEPSAWYNNQTYVDTLSPAAIDRFVQVTHEAYLREVGDDFGGLVPAIFTDEPQFTRKSSLANPQSQADQNLPITGDFCQTFFAAFGFHIEDRLPEVFWDLPAGQPSRARWCYHDHITQRFSDAYAKTIGQWCDRHGLRFTGHMMEEPTLHSQTEAIGEAMRPLSHFQIPGIDMLCDAHEYTTAKQAQSVAHQYGREAVLSELYGVTNWDFTFAGHLGQGNWQAALGISVRVPHLAWVSMAGEAKRDYPAAIGWQSPWFEQYPLVEDHFSRVHTLLTRGQPLVRVGVIHPVESYWLVRGPNTTTSQTREALEKAFADVTNHLLFGLIDFDFISEALLPEQCLAGTAPLAVGKMRYDAIVVPTMKTIRGSTLDRLEQFTQAGGLLIFAGDVPDCVDAQPSDRAQKLAAKSIRVPLEKTLLLSALQPVCMIRAADINGAPAKHLLHQLRQDRDDLCLFICNIQRETPCDATVAIRGDWKITRFDTFTGKTNAIATQLVDGFTRFNWHFDGNGSVLARLTPGGKHATELTWPKPDLHEISRLADPVSFTLSEPNVLLLDQAQWRLNDEPWNAREEILRLDNLVRAKLGLPARSGHIPQPWTDSAPAPVLATLAIKFDIDCQVAVRSPLLALENAGEAQIFLDGKAVPSAIRGHWVDEAIQTVALPDLSIGRHELIISRPFSRKTVSVEWCYLLGDFGVEVAGRHTRIIAMPRTLAFGDITHQGLPFYAGNITYHGKFESDGSTPQTLHAGKFAAALLTASVNGKPVGPMAFHPYQVSLGVLPAGTHALDITAFGTRYNAFGQVHAPNKEYKWWGPHTWRLQDEDWAYEYQLKPSGILVAPRLLAAKP